MPEQRSVYAQLGKERRDGQRAGEIPPWFTTLSWQMFKEMYSYNDQTVKETYERIARRAASHTEDQDYWFERFFELFWKGWLAASTPVLANMGTDRGCAVSCSGGYVPDSVYGFYDAQLEAALLSQNGFGTSGYLGDIRPRGAPISRGGFASGVVPVIRDFVQVARDISQGGVRRGAWAGYLFIDGEDFWEVTQLLKNNPDDCNIGWLITDNFIKRLDDGDPDALSRYQRALHVKMVTGKGYFFKVDTANRLRPLTYKERGLLVKASNLCTEITLFSDEEHTFTCVLSSMNLVRYDEWKDTDAVFVATVFLDCVAQDFIKQGRGIQGLEKAVRFTEKSRALGLGALGFHTYLQNNNIAFESLEAHFKNIEIFKKIEEESLKASQWMAKEWGEPEWCRGFGVRNTHRTAIAPNTSSAIICGSVSQGIEPVYKNAFTQGGSAGEMSRINPSLIPVMKAKGVYNDKTIDDIIDNKGSVQHVEWLTDHEKLVFKTAFEVDPRAILRLASTRQKYICQAQSLNLFFSANEDEEFISEIHKEALKDPNIISLYYLRSEAGVKPSRECIACEG